MKNSFELIITYAEYREDFIAEIWRNNVHIAEIYFGENNEKMVEIFHFDAPFISFNLTELMLILHEADKKLSSDKRANKT